MKKFLRRILIIVVAFFVVDFLYGAVCSFMIAHAKGGSGKMFYDMAYEMTEDVYLFGSSRCRHHYVSTIMEDSLNLSVYNFGQGGRGNILYIGMFAALRERYYPKAVICEVTPDYDLYKHNYSKDLTPLIPYYNIPSVRNLIKQISATDYYACLLKMYQYNDLIVRVVREYLNMIPPEHIKGYTPLSTVLDVNMYDPVKKKGQMVDSLRYTLWEDMIKDCEGKTQIIFTISPLWHNTGEEDIEPIKKLCAQYDIPLINHYSDTNYIYNRAYYRDPRHFNADGAEVFTKEIAAEIRQVLRERGVELPE